MSASVKRVGTRALIVDLPDLQTVMDFYAALSATPLSRQTDVVAAARTVLVTFDSPTATTNAIDVLANYSPDTADLGSPRDIEIDVRYDGEDVETLAASLGMSPDELIDWHTSTNWVAAFGGFAPGFTYCVPDDASRALVIPRRDSPRTAVPAGAVALAGEFSAVYPRTSPGGWQLIGTTNTPMWDSTATPPALVAPGDRVHYRAVDALPGDAELAHKHLATPPRRPVFTLDDAGLQTLYQDLGRQGNGNLGVTTSGSADRASARTANAAELAEFDAEARRILDALPVQLRLYYVHDGRANPLPAQCRAHVQFLKHGNGGFIVRARPQRQECKADRALVEVSNTHQNVITLQEALKSLSKNPYRWARGIELRVEVSQQHRDVVGALALSDDYREPLAHSHH